MAVNVTYKKIKIIKKKDIQKMKSQLFIGKNNSKKDKGDKENKENNKYKIKASYSAGKIIALNNEAMNLYGKSRIGEIINGKIIYSFSEAFYLLEKKKLEIFYQEKKLNEMDFLRLAEKKEKNFWVKFCVFKDIREKGYIIKTALKFGAEFRIYNKGIKPGEDHAKWIVYPVFEKDVLTWHDFAAKNRVAHSTKKNLLIGIVDEEGEVTYYEITWLKP